MSDSPSDGFVRVAAVADVADGQMIQADADGAAVLLARVGGRLHACTAHCTHYGAPLADGVLDGTRVVCPWHHAAFDVTTGALCDPPALDALRSFEVREQDGDVFVRVPPDADDAGEEINYAESDGRTPAMADAGADDRLFLVLGAGAAAQAAAEALREHGFAGRIALTTPEDAPPYDRTKLSKAYAAGKAGEDALPLRDADFQQRHGIETWTGRTAERLDPDAKTVRFADGETVTYDACLVATGGAPRRLDVPGADLPGVHLLRSLADAHALVEAAEGAHTAVIIGGSFIGMETASSLTDRGLAVTVVDRAAVPLGAALGAEVGGVFQKAAEAKGVSFRLEASIERIERDGDRLAVVLGLGERLVGDLVVMGVGVSPATGFLDGAAFRHDDGALATDATLCLADGLFAAGDVALYPEARLEAPVRIEHWRLAQQHGRHAAQAMLGAEAPFTGVPFFWTGQFGLGLRYVGHATDPDETVIDGSLEGKSFVAYFIKNGTAVAAAAVGRDKDAAAFHVLLARNGSPSADDLRGEFDLVKRVERFQG